ncbi:phosphogluconate dehydratase [Budvicia aquatica]|uniref:Phosphogluconate dehydratase n=1 Tax=Budvicia aquatica TaxID=82979 RepID=A0A484ZCN8_9GAMM|nr:phosphogluconate dehydratase [Budvicia aquatica]
MNLTVEHITQKIIARSKESREAYLAKIDAAKSATVHRSQLSCGNLAHGVRSLFTG